MAVIVVKGDARRGAYRRRRPGNALDRDEHGLAGYQLGCRCPHCAAGRRRYDREWRAARRLLATGSATWKVSNGPVARHIAQLRGAGLSLDAIARRAGVSAPTVQRIAARPRARCWKLVADAVLAVEP